jgi:hypothetical protein
MSTVKLAGNKKSSKISVITVTKFYSALGISGIDTG